MKFRKYICNIKHLQTIDYLINFFIHSMTLFSVKRDISVFKRQSHSLRVPLCCCAHRVLSLFSSCLHFLSQKSSLCRVKRAYCSTAVPPPVLDWEFISDWKSPPHFEVYMLKLLYTESPHFIHSFL